MSSKQTLPLQGIRIIDFSRLLPGPWATQMLAELGADVIKVEPPVVGDPSRHNVPSYRENSVYFNQVNANKRSIALDLATPEGRAISRKLLETADVVFETYRPAVAKRLGIDYPTINAYNPRVIYCSITGFGQHGPLSHIAGHDLVIQGMTGSLGCALDVQNPPEVPGFQAADYAGALFSVIGVQAAIAQRAKTGVGCEIDLSMFEALYPMTLIPLSSEMARAAGFSGEPRMETLGGNPRYSTHLSKDGKPVAVSLLEHKAWGEFCKLVDRMDLYDPNESPTARLSDHGENGPIYRKAISDYCAAHTWQELMDRMNETGIAICPIVTPLESLSLDHVKERRMVDYIDHPTEGRIPYLVNPLFRAGLVEDQRRPAPQLGQDADEILRELGYGDGDISRFRDAKVI